MIPLDIANYRFKKNPAIEVIEFTKLTTAQKEFLNSCIKSKEFFGLACWKNNPERTPKIICKETALLLFTLDGEGGYLPSYLNIDEIQEHLMEILYEGLLLLESAEGVFSDYISLAPSSKCQSIQNHNELQNLSEKAIYYAFDLPISDPIAVAARLYFYNRIPVSHEDYCEKSFHYDFLGVSKDSLSEKWNLKKRGGYQYSWIMCSNRSNRWNLDKGDKIYKLYISPATCSLKSCFGNIVSALLESGVKRFKYGNSIYGVSRPDKILAYFETFEHMKEASCSLEKVLSSQQSHGVPFTCQIRDLNSLSWGVDPPRSNHYPDWREKESWRLWVVNHISVAIIDFKRVARKRDQLLEYICARLLTKGIDAQTWTPIQ